MGSQQFCLKWNNHQSNMLTVFEQLLSNEALVDVTLACEGLSLKAHKMVLSACSPFFQALFVENPCKHPIVILKDMRYMDLKAIVEFMYRGEVNVSQDQLSALLKTAETLKVKGLAEVTGENRQGLVPVGTTEGDTKGTTTPRAESPPLSKRKRGRPRRRSPSDSNKSDSEDAMTRVKGAPESPEIIEDGSLSSDRLAVPSPAKIAATSSKVLLAASSATTTTTNAAAVVSTTREPVDSVVDDADGSPEDADFEVDASNLMEQSMTTENVPVFSDVPSSSQLAESQTHHTGSSQESSAAPLIPASLPSDISISTQDIKPLPSSLIPYDEPTISPVVPGQQQSADGSASSSMMFMDSSGVPAIAGPSNYHPDKQPSTPSHGPKTRSRRAHMVFLKKSETASQEAPKATIGTAQPETNAATEPPVSSATPVSASAIGKQASASSSVQIIPVTSKTAPGGVKTVSLSAKQIEAIKQLAANQQGKVVVIPVKHRVDVPIKQVITEAIQQRARTPAAGVLATKEPKTITLLQVDAPPTVQETPPAHPPKALTMPIKEKAVAALTSPTPDLTPASEVVVLPSESTPAPGQTDFTLTAKKAVPARGKKAGTRQAVRAKRGPAAKAGKKTPRTAKKPSPKPGIQTRKVVLSDPVEGQNVITLPLHDEGDDSIHQVVVETHPHGSATSQEAPTTITYTLQKGNKTVYLCSSCPYTTLRKAHLVEHERTHTGEKPFKCRYCDYASSRNCHLKDHERTHSVEKPFKCCLCDYSAKRKHHLQDHIKTHIKRRKTEQKEGDEEVPAPSDDSLDKEFQM